MTATDALRTSDDITDRLLTAAIEVFTERGIEKAGVALIARRAGLTTGAIYSRWEGKQDLLLDALDVVLMQQIAQLLAVGPDASAADVLGSLGADLMNREAAGDALMLEALVMARRDPAFRTTLRDRMADEESHLATLIDNGKDAGIIDPTLSARAILTLCQAISLGFVVMGAIEKPTADADEWSTVIDRLVTAALPATDPVPDHEDLS